MSRAAKRHKQPTIQRASIPMSMPTSGNVVTIPASVWQAMLNHMAPQKDQSQTFSPGAPLEPIPGITPKAGPRQFAFMPGINLSGNDRTLLREYIPAFDQLRMLAQTYSAIGMAERVLCDLIPRMQVGVTLRPDLKAQGGNDKNFKKEISQYRAFFERPDGQDSIHEWLRKAIVDQTQVDALVIFKRRTRGGTLVGLDLVDGTIIKPLLDERGRMPSPPYAAFQQYAYGTQGQGYTTDEMIYHREAPRTFTPYGFSRVERIILLVNQALRKQNKDLARFTEGNIPAGLMEVPEGLNWTPDEIDTYEQSWNSLMAGNAQQQVRIRFTQPGFKYTSFSDDMGEHQTEFDQFLLNMTAGVYGVSMADLAVTGDIHKSADDGQQNMLYRRTIEPIAIAYAGIFTRILRDDFHDDRFVVTFGGYDEQEDLNGQVTAYSMAIQYAMLAPSDAAALLGFPDVPKTGPGFVSPTSGFVPLANFELGSGLRKAADDATLTSLQLQPAVPSPSPDQPQDEEQPVPTQNKPKDPEGKSDEQRYTVSDLIAFIEEKLAEARKEGTAPVFTRETQGIEGVSQAATRSAGTGVAMAALAGDATTPYHETSPIPRDLAVELNLWRGRALDDVRKGRPLRGFTSTVIPESLHNRISDDLAECQTVEEVRAVFRRAKDIPEDLGSETAKELTKLKMQGVKAIRWRAHAGCEHCLPNDGLVRAVGETYPTGAYLPPMHPGCTCTYEIVEREAAMVGKD